MKKFRFLAAFAAVALSGLIAFGGCGLLSNKEEEISDAMRMYNEAVTAGYEGSYLDFLEEFGDWLTTEPSDKKPEDEKPDDKADEKDPVKGDDTEVVSGVSQALLSAVKIETAFSVGTISGAGVVYSVDYDKWDAYVITNYHNLYYNGTISSNISLWLYGGENNAGKLSATYYAGSAHYDIAVLYIQGTASVTESGLLRHTNASVLQNSDVRAVTVADSDDVRAGDKVYAIGNPLGMGISVTGGVVSVEAEYVATSLTTNPYTTVNSLEMRIDAAINHGNSGGGLFNERGEFIGIVNLRREPYLNGNSDYSQTGVIEGFSYAIPGNMAIAVASNLIYRKSMGYSSASYANIGISYKTTSRSYFNEETGKVDIVEEITVSGVTILSAAGGGKLMVNDVLISVTLNGVEKQLTRAYMLDILCVNIRANDKVTFKVLRGGEEITTTLTFGTTNFTSYN